MMTTAKDRIDFIHGNLAAEVNRATFPLDLFNTHFAPFLFGEVPLQKDSELFSTWIGIAGSPMASVDIINKAGQVEFTVPPLFDTNVIDILRKDRGLNQVIDNYNNYSNALPAVAMGFVKNNLLPAADEAIANSDHKEALSGWAKVAQYYNKLPGKQTEATPAGDISNNGDDDLSYDV